MRLKSPDPRAAPEIRLNYLSTPEDQRVAVDSLRLARRIVNGTDMRRYQPEESVPGPSFPTDAELVKAAGNVGTTIFHPIGTCKKGRADGGTAVVDARLRVRGIGRLRVVDASIGTWPCVRLAERTATRRDPSFARRPQPVARPNKSA